MAALVCDICGGKLSMGSGGIAVCESCGMEHTRDRLQEKIQEIKGTVRIDNSHMVDNYLNIARTAYDASNLTEAETYCNKIIEISPNNAEAWLIKGRAAGWQSTLTNPRFSESIAAFSKAILNTPEEESDSLIEQTSEEITNLANALITLRSERFSKWPDEDETTGFLNDLNVILNAIRQYISQVSDKIIQSDIMRPIAGQIDDVVFNTWYDKILPDYNGKENRPDENEWRDFIDRVGYCTNLLSIAIDLSDEDDEEDIHRYEFLINLHNEAIESCSWDYDFDEFGKNWIKEYMLADSAIKVRKELIDKYKSEINKIKRSKEVREAEQKAEAARIEKETSEFRYKKYWEEHSEEKKLLETEIQFLKEQIEIGNSEIQKLKSNREVLNLEERLKKLEHDKASLGMFRLIEKKVVQDKIDTLASDLSNLIKKRDSTIVLVKDKLKPLEVKLEKAQAELSRAR